jgi:hypothetical protein
VDKFAGSLIFWVGPSHQNPEKNAGKSEFRIILDEPVLQNPEKLRGNPGFKNFFGPLKIAGNRGKIRILKPVHCGKTAKNFWMSLSFKILRHRGKICISRIFWVPLKIAGNRRKIQISKPVYRRKTVKNLSFKTRSEKFSNWQTLPSSSCFSSHLPPNNLPNSLPHYLVPSIMVLWMMLRIGSIFSPKYMLTTH